MLQSETAAAWAQAVGSFIALFVAIGLAWWQQKQAIELAKSQYSENVEEERRRWRREILGGLRAIRIEMHMNQMVIRDTKDGLRKSPNAMPDDNIIVIKTNLSAQIFLSHIGMLARAMEENPDQTTSQPIIEFYSLLIALKGAIEPYGLKQRGFITRRVKENIGSLDATYSAAKENLDNLLRHFNSRIGPYP